MSTINVNGKKHTLEIKDQAILVDGAPAEIQKIQEASIMLISKREKLEIPFEDLLRAAQEQEQAAQLVAAGLAARQNQQDNLVELAKSKVYKISEKLPCGYRQGNGLCSRSTNEIYMTASNNVPGTFVILPVCQKHIFVQLKEQLFELIGKRDETHANRGIYPIGKE